MPRCLTGSAVAVALALSAASALAQDVPPCRSRSVNVEHAHNVSKSNGAVGFLCAQGSPARVHLELRQTTIAAVLSALQTAYDISYSSSTALNETRDGVYAGSLRQVISRLLSDYNYVVKLKDMTLDVNILGKKGDHAVAAPILAEVTDNPVRRAARGARTH